MISQEFLKNLATKHQSTEFNIQREYLQHLFLAFFYQSPGSSNVLFKGGTALKFIYGSCRFSEDLDFSGFGISPKNLEKLLIETLSQIEKEGISVHINEAKTTSGGYLAVYRGKILEEEIKIQLEVSFRKKENLKGEAVLITQDFIPPYTLLYLPEEALVSEKMKALLERDKARDWYDLYFILRKGLAINQKLLSLPENKTFKELLLAQLKKKKNTHVFKELKYLLPVSHHRILRNFKDTLEREIKRCL